VSKWDQTADVVTLIHFYADGIGVDAGGVDKAAEGEADGGDVVHEVFDQEAEVFTFFYDKGLGADVPGFTGICFFDTGFIDHAALTIGPGDPIYAPGLEVREEIVQTLVGVHYARRERGRGDATKTDILIKVICFHEMSALKQQN
jgi:hypothetical protein